MITEADYLKAKHIIDEHEKAQLIIEEYETKQLRQPLIVRTLPNNSDMVLESMKRAKIESELVKHLAAHYFQIGATWMKHEVLKTSTLVTPTCIDGQNYIHEPY